MSRKAIHSTTVKMLNIIAKAKIIFEGNSEGILQIYTEGEGFRLRLQNLTF